MLNEKADNIKLKKNDDKKKDSVVKQTEEE